MDMNGLYGPQRLNGKHQLRRWLTSPLASWRSRRAPFDHGELLLSQRRIFIVPSRAGLAYAVLLAGLFIGSVNYSLNMGFALTFLITGCVLVSLYLCFRNLAWLHLQIGRSEPVFVGMQAEMTFHIANHGKHARHALAVSLRHIDGSARDKAQPVVEKWIDIPKFGQQTLSLSTLARQRGWQAMPGIRLQTSFPFGLFRAWSNWHPELMTLVYPMPEDNAPPLPAASEINADQQAGNSGQEDFSGVRPWQAGDPINRLAWRQIARLGDAHSPLISKYFEGGARAGLCIDEAALSSMPIENRLSRMTRWILEAEQRGLAYSLRIGSSMIAASNGAEHRDECLRALALYQVPQQAADRQ